MSNLGNSRHLKRLAMSKKLKVRRKSHKFLEKSGPGAHKAKESATIGILLRDYLKSADSLPIAKKIVNEGKILLNGAPAKSTKQPAGLMDILSIPAEDKHYRVGLDKKGRFTLQEIKKADAETKFSKITDKKIIGGGKIQLNLHDGRNQLVSREEDQFKVGDTLEISVPKQKITQFHKLKEGSRCLVYRGKHAGRIGTLKKISASGRQKENAVITLKSGDDVITLKEYLFVVDENFG